MGGGVFIAGIPNGSSTTFTDCTLKNNVSLHSAGGIFLWYGNNTLENCTLSGNHAGSGGGMMVQGGEVYISNCDLFDNIATQGGAIAIVDDAVGPPTISGTVICGNSQEVEGQIYGDWIDNGGNTITDMCASNCLADTNEDGVVDVSDLLYVASFIGTTESNADINNDGIVDVADLLISIGAFGPCT